MRVLKAVFVLLVSQWSLLAFAFAGDPIAPDSSSLERIRNAVSAGDSSSAIEAIRALPTDQRMGWLSELHQSNSGQNPNGGASMADYTSLIGLIESVIDAEWQSSGGTAAMLPYRQGVRIDPNGLIERLEPSKDALASLKTLRDLKKDSSPKKVALDELGDWQQSTPLRWVSLHQLDQQVAERVRGTSAKRASIAMELLGGLYRIDYLAYDKESKEWYLGGPAGNLVVNPSRELLNPETGLPPVLLEDLLGIAPHVLNNKGELGCTIDPDPQRLSAAHEMSKTTSAMRGIQKQPERWSEQWRKTLGRQHAKVVGLHQDSPTGYAMLLADVHMKRLGLGLETCPTQLKTYWQEKESLASLNSASDSSMVRWWFSLTDHKIPVDPERKIYHFASSNVQVLSEGQMMNAKGERVSASSPDLAADAFAKKFSLHFDRLQRDYPVYGRLRHIADLSVALEIVRNEIQQGHGKPFQAIDNPEVQPKLPVAPTEVDSIAATHRMPNGSMSVMISGGVAIHPTGLLRRVKVDKSETNKVSLESSNDSSKSTEVLVANSHSRSSDVLLIPKRDKSFWK